MDEAVRTARFVRNACLRFWMNGEKVSKNAIDKHTMKLRAEYKWAKKLNSTACKRRAWAAMSRFYDNCKKGVKPVGHPRLKKSVRSVEFKQSVWEPDAANKRLTQTDGFRVGDVKRKGTRNLILHRLEDIKGLWVVKRADGYCALFLVDVERLFNLEASGKATRLDVWLKAFNTDAEGNDEPNPHFYRKAQQLPKKLQRRVSRKGKGSNNRKKALAKLAVFRFKVSRQRKGHAVKLVWCAVASHDVVASEELKVRNMTRNLKLSKSIGDTSWREFRQWVKYIARVMGKIAIPVNPAYTSQIRSARHKHHIEAAAHRCADRSGQPPRFWQPARAARRQFLPPRPRADPAHQ
ncbi:putative transposase [Deinococcus hopiensis KR-140]|uniref:Putative transposase n=2 Tax=Deinococcus TaxID=1298 RepID=A0A1W1UEX4_9DEIO|nr:putative transposase [Deinococcus hopiensis KR-140]